MRNSRKIILLILILSLKIYLPPNSSAEDWFAGNPAMLNFRDSQGYLFSDTARIEITEDTVRLRTPPWGYFQDFSYKLPLRIEEKSGRDLFDYSLMVQVDTARLISLGRMKKDCADVRFGDLADSYPYWLESGCNTSRTKFWVKVPLIPARQTREIFIYYGNSSAKDASAADAVFEPMDKGNWALDWKGFQSTSCVGLKGWNSLKFDDRKWEDVPRADLDHWKNTSSPCDQCDWYLRKKFISLAAHTNNIVYTIEEGSMRITINQKVVAEKPIWECHGLGVDSGVTPLPIEKGEIVIGVQCSHGRGDKKCKIGDLGGLKYLRQRKSAVFEPEVTPGKERSSTEPVTYSTVSQFVITPPFGTGKKIANWVKLQVNTRGKGKGSLRIYYKYSNDGGKSWLPQWLGGTEIKENGQFIFLSHLPVNNDGNDRIKFKLALSSPDGLERSPDVDLLTLYYNDREKPRLLSLKAINPTQIELVFSEEVLQADKQENYSLQGLEIKKVEKISEKIYRLTTSKQTTAKQYLLRLFRIIDFAHNPLDPGERSKVVKGYDNLPRITRFSAESLRPAAGRKEKRGTFYTNKRKIKVEINAADAGGSIAGYVIKEHDAPPLLNYQGYRQQLRVKNNFDFPLPPGYPLKYNLNHPLLVKEKKSLASGDDLRIVYFNGSNYEQISRSSELWFENQKEIAPGRSDYNYYLYYGDFSQTVPPPLLKYSYATVLKASGRVLPEKKGDNFVYFELLKEDYKIAKGDLLAYEIKFAPDSTSFSGGVEAIFSDPDSTTLSILLSKDAKAQDQQGISLDPRNDLSYFARGRWYERRFNLSALVGYYGIKKWLVGLEGDQGTTVLYLSNVRIEDASGKIKHRIKLPALFRNKGAKVLWNKNYSGARMAEAENPLFPAEPLVLNMGGSRFVSFSEFTADSPFPQSYKLRGGEGIKTLFAWAIDNTNNLSPPATASIYLDLTPPRLNPQVKVLNPYTLEFSFNELLDESREGTIEDKKNYSLEPKLSLEKIILSGKDIYAEGDVVYHLISKEPQEPGKTYTLRINNIFDRSGNPLDPLHNSVKFQAWDYFLPVVEEIRINGQLRQPYYTNQEKLSLKIKASDQPAGGKIIRWLVNISCQRPRAGLMKAKGFSSPPESYRLKKIEGEHTLCVWVMDNADNVSLLTPRSAARVIFDQSSPEIKGINLVSSSQIDVIFNEKVSDRQGSISSLQNLFNIDGAVISNTSTLDTQTFRLSLSGALSAGDHLLKVKKISDRAGNMIKLNRKAFILYPPILNVNSPPQTLQQNILKGENNPVAFTLTLAIPPDSSYPLEVSSLKMKFLGDLFEGDKVNLTIYTDNNSDGRLRGEKKLGKATYLSSAKSFFFSLPELRINPGEIQDLLVVFWVSEDAPAGKKLKFKIAPDSFNLLFPSKVSTFLPLTSAEFIITEK